MIRKRVRRLVWRFLHRFAPPETVVALQYRQTLLSRRTGGFPPKNMVVTSEVPSGTVLVLAPHPDDEVIGPGGTLSLHLKNQDPVTILYLTDGRGSNLSDSRLVAIRRREAMSIGERYGLKQIFWDIPDTTLSNEPETVDSLAQVLGEIRPDFIYLPSFFDRQRDHFAANKLLASVISNMGNPVVTILGYEIWDNISYPNYIVDISEVFEVKTTMMRMYETPMQTTDFVALCRHRNALHYSLFVDSAHREPEGYAEAFYRLDSSHFTALFDTYVESLIASNSPLR